MMMFTNNAFAEMERIQRQFDRALNTVIAPQITNRWTPAMELQETPESYILRAIIPGMDTQVLNIEASKKAIAISGKTNRPELAEGQKYLYSEFPVGEFNRIVTLPEPIIHTKVQADYIEG